MYEIRDFKSSGFYIDHFLKNLQIALEEAEAMNMELPDCPLLIPSPDRFKKKVGFTPKP